MVSNLVHVLLHKRGIRDADDIEKFLKPEYERDTHDPMLLHDMERAIARILSATAEGEKIAIYADFDCDGIPGAALMHDFFTKIDYANVRVYIPHRDREGHGFHVEAVEMLAAEGVSLIITIDCGVGSIEATQKAKECGVDVIITDHHEVTNGLPPAAAVVNPKLGAYPFKDLCGAAVTWKLVQALLREGRKRGLPSFAAIHEGWEKWLLDLVAISTIADLVPLVGENRVLAHFGLTVLRKSPRKGIRALCSAARVQQATLTEDDIGFSFAPRINAASRMDEPELAFKLLTTESADEAEALAAQLESLNRKRRGAVAAMVREAKSRVRARYSSADRVVVLGDTEWKPSLCGLAANSIMEERGGIAIMWGRDANGKLKGSARSDGQLSVVELFARVAEAFEEYGGHHASGGFTVLHEAVHTLPERLAAAARDLHTSAHEHEAAGADPSREGRAEADPSRHDRVAVDAELVLRDISIGFFKELSRLAPFGVGNPKPLFRVRNARITFARQFGKEMNHTEVTVVCSETGVSHRAFQFFKTPMDFTLAPSPGTAADLLATLEKDSFRGPDRLALRIADIVAPRS
ncbi:MAG TPA: single-stranded-DNA-specific exonuclease RecJ [Candidatus Paceibacterota bacterium]|nr:single-stranded-DNA-specific exonuclease RecJ [Candidatus Paceibacterota bacterium]